MTNFYTINNKNFSLLISIANNDITPGQKQVVASMMPPVTASLKKLACADLILFDLRQRFPIQARGILNGQDFRR